MELASSLTSACNTPEPTCIFTPSVTPVVIDLIFADSFESGFLHLVIGQQRWGRFERQSSDGARWYTGHAGALQWDITGLYIPDETPNGEPRYANNGGAMRWIDGVQKTA